MHYHQNTIPRIVGPILVHVSCFVAGVEKRYYSDFNEALYKLGVYNFDFKKDVPYVIYGPSVSRRIWFYDGCGDLILPSKIKVIVDDILSRRTPCRSWYTKRHVSENHFRRHPVPNVNNGGWRGNCRQVRTHQELRTNLTVMEDDIRCFGIKIRGKRKNIPTDYDDIMYARRGDNWKNYRKTQWK